MDEINVTFLKTAQLTLRALSFGTPLKAREDYYINSISNYNLPVKVIFTFVTFYLVWAKSAFSIHRIKY